MMNRFWDDYRKAIRQIEPNDCFVDRVLERAKRAKPTTTRRFHNRASCPKRFLLAACLILIAGVGLVAELGRSEGLYAFAAPLRLENPFISIDLGKRGSVEVLEDGSSAAVAFDIGFDCSASDRGSVTFASSNRSVAIGKGFSDLDACSLSLTVGDGDSTQGVIRVVVDAGVDLDRALYDEMRSDVVYADLVLRCLDKLSETEIVVSADNFESATYGFSVTDDTRGELPAVLARGESLLIGMELSTDQE